MGFLARHTLRSKRSACVTRTEPPGSHTYCCSALSIRRIHFRTCCAFPLFQPVSCLRNILFFFCCSLSILLHTYPSICPHGNSSSSGNYLAASSGGPRLCNSKTVANAISKIAKCHECHIHTAFYTLSPQVAQESYHAPFPLHSAVASLYFSKPLE